MTDLEHFTHPLPVTRTGKGILPNTKVHGLTEEVDWQKNWSEQKGKKAEQKITWKKWTQDIIHTAPIGQITGEALDFGKPYKRVIHRDKSR